MAAIKEKILSIFGPTKCSAFLTTIGKKSDHNKLNRGPADKTRILYAKTFFGSESPDFSTISRKIRAFFYVLSGRRE